MNDSTVKGAFLLAILVGLIFLVIHFKDQNKAPAPVKPAPPVPAKRHFVYVSGARCPACNQMEKTFAAPKVKERLDKDFVFEKVSGKDANEKYSVKAYPTYLILEGGKEVRRATGYKGADEFLAWLDARNEDAP